MELIEKAVAKSLLEIKAVCSDLKLHSLGLQAGSHRFIVIIEEYFHIRKSVRMCAAGWLISYRSSTLMWRL
jgi:hypothetical protein